MPSSTQPSMYEEYTMDRELYNALRWLAMMTTSTEKGAFPTVSALNNARKVLEQYESVQRST